MAFKGGLVDRAYFLRWIDQPTVPDVDALIADIERQAKNVGGQVVYVGVHGRGGADAPPGAEVRDHILNSAARLLKSASSLELVMVGDGIGMSLVRSAIRGMVVVGQGRLGPDARGRVHIHRTPLEALQRTQSQLSHPAEAIHAEAAKLGFFSA